MESLKTLAERPRNLRAVAMTLRVSETEITLRVTTRPAIPLRDSITPLMITKALGKAAK